MEIFLDPTNNNPASVSFGNLVEPGTRGIRAWIARRREIARITRELQAHSDRQLNDLGLARSDIPDVARGRWKRA
jgi:uncharacterized protein YjiS (DUF1127 family)